MHLTPDHIVVARWGFAHINATILCTWILMGLLVICSRLLTRHLAGPEAPRSRWQNAVEVIVVMLRTQIRTL